MTSIADRSRKDSKNSKIRPRDSLLKGKPVFVATLAIGSLSIFGSDPMSSPFFLGVFIPLLCMAIYLFFGLNGLIDTVDTETFADSVYYMGFLLTLISLSAALFYLRNENPALGLLVSKFGLALLTTIVGLGVRVTLVNFQLTGGQGRQAVEEKLSIAVERFNNDLELTCDKMELLLHGSVENAELSSDAIKEASNEAASTIREVNQANQAEMTRLFDGIGSEWSRSVENLTSDLERKVAEAVNASAAQIGELGKKVEDEISKFRLDSDVFGKVLEEPLNDLAHTIRTARILLAKEFGQLQGAAESHSSIKEQFEILSLTLASGDQGLKALHKYGENLAGAFSTLSALDNSLTQLGQKSAEVAGQFEILGSTVSKSSSSFSGDVETSKQSFLKLNQSLNALLHSVMKQSEEMGDLVVKIAADAEQGRSSLKLVQDNLIESSEVIVKHLS